MSMKKVVFYVLLILTALPVEAQQYGMYQTCEASITFLSHNKTRDEKLPGTVIILSNYKHHLEIRTMLPSMTDYSDRSNVNYPESPISLELKMIVSSNEMQQYLTSEKVFITNGVLQLNNISKPVSIQYSPFPEGTENEGKMRVSLIAAFKLSDFFPGKYPNESIAFVIHNSIVNRQ